MNGKPEIQSAEQTPENSVKRDVSQLNNQMFWKIVFVIGFGFAFVVFFLVYDRYLSPEKVITAERAIRTAYAGNPVVFLVVAFLIYMVATGLSLPISTVLSLTYAWILGWVAIPLLNLAATCGATLAFLSARFLLRDWVQARFAQQLVPINLGFQRDGAFYVVSLRMIAVFPYFVVNLVLGLVPIRVPTYFLATMLGMLPLNFAFVYLGMQLPSAEEFLVHGTQSLVSWPIVLGIGLIGLVPLLFRIVFQQSQGTEPVIPDNPNPKAM